MVRKILRSLSKAWHPKVIAIQEAKDLNMLSLDALISFLKTYEIELNEASEDSNKKGKSIGLKSTQRRSSSFKTMRAVEKEEENSSNDNSYEKDEIAHLVKGISKAWIRRKKKKRFIPKKDKKVEVKKSEIICFKCKEPRHLRSECPKLKKNSKKKAMMATWEDLERRNRITRRGGDSCKSMLHGRYSL